MKAIWNDTVIAEAPREELIYIEGNWYFPPERITKEYFEPNDEHTTCFWKGEASYYDVTVNGEKNPSAAWYYPEPKDGSIDRVGHDYTSYVAFWRGVTVTD